MKFLTKDMKLLPTKAGWHEKCSVYHVEDLPGVLGEQRNMIYNNLLISIAHLYMSMIRCASLSNKYENIISNIYIKNIKIKIW